MYTYDKRIPREADEFECLKLLTEALTTKRTKKLKKNSTTDPDEDEIRRRDIQRDKYRNQWLGLLRIAWADRYILNIFNENPTETVVTDTLDHGFNFICDSLGAILFKLLLFDTNHLSIIERENDEEYSEFDLPILEAKGLLIFKII